MPEPLRPSRAPLTLAALALLVPACLAQAAVPAPVESAQDLVNKVIARELLAEETPGRYIYRLRRQAQDGSWTRDIVDTRDGLVSRLILVNDQPPNAEERAKDDRHLD